MHQNKVKDYGYSITLHGIRSLRLHFADCRHCYMEREALSASRFCFFMGKRFEACHLGISSRRCAYPGRHTLGTYIICRGFTHPPHLVGHALSDVCSEFTSRCVATIYVATRLFFNTDGTEFSELPSGTFGYYGASLCDGRIKRKQPCVPALLLRP